ncbi:DUF6090 family protein [Hanstruepera marina]|uniref:DUF6090 family protein n=1 Tax=Hanstruepera marina TaxID=2873265 RepID=UPI001CA5FDF6|nr:DUF6090 family protein [Hanstruepera marina]
MIKFFRRIRKSLLTENKFSKYILYAIGEIILVVIGILIALQINNWNEKRKLINEEKTTIASLKLEFQKNVLDLESHINTTQAIMNAGKELLKHTDPNYEFGSLKLVDSLLSMTPRLSIWDPSLYTLSNIKSSGKLSNLSNEDLKIKLIEWETFYSNLLDWSEFHVERGSKYFDYLIENSMNRNLHNYGPFQYGTSKFEGSNEALLKDKSFENIITHRTSHNGFMLEYYKEAKTRLNEIIKLCESYEN